MSYVVSESWTTTARPDQFDVFPSSFSWFPYFSAFPLISIVEDVRSRKILARTSWEFRVYISRLIVKRIIFIQKINRVGTKLKKIIRDTLRITFGSIFIYACTWFIFILTSSDSTNTINLPRTLLSFFIVVIIVIEEYRFVSQYIIFIFTHYSIFIYLYIIYYSFKNYEITQNQYQHMSVKEFRDF